MKIRPPSGSLSAYTRTVKGKTYPLVSGSRDPQNPDHWNWQFTFKQPDANGKLRSHSFSVPRAQVDGVREMIREARAIADIMEFLGKTL